MPPHGDGSPASSGAGNRCGGANLTGGRPATCSVASTTQPSGMQRNRRTTTGAPCARCASRSSMCCLSNVSVRDAHTCPATSHSYTSSTRSRIPARSITQNGTDPCRAACASITAGVTARAYQHTRCHPCTERHTPLTG